MLESLWESLGELVTELALSSNRSWAARVFFLAFGLLIVTGVVFAIARCSAS